jgi:hypothetical protein
VLELIRTAVAALERGTEFLPLDQCREPCQIEGRVLDTAFALVVRASDQRIGVAVDARTTISGFDRAGLPYLEEGDAVRVRGHACHDGDPSVAFARLIEPGR